MQPPQAYFWSVHSRPELDLHFIHKGRSYSLEFKYNEAPKVSRSMHPSMDLVELERLWVIIPGETSFQEAVARTVVIAMLERSSRKGIVTWEECLHSTNNHDLRATSHPPMSKSIEFNLPEPRFTHCEFRLLRGALQQAASMSFPFDEDEQMRLNTSGPQADLEEVANALERLFADQLIGVRRQHKEGPALSRSEIEAALRKEFSASYYLTKQGGHQLERFVRPRWQHHIEGDSFLLDEDAPATTQQGELRGVCRDLLERILRAFPAIGRKLDEKSVVWEELTDWPPYYWKVLPCGWQVSYQYIVEWEDLLTREAAFEHSYVLWLKREELFDRMW